ncbi:Uncharacterized protein HZ326_22862 [Fusarium oxysporum f. sp. albedinis]|nr:Uncharacterized protein HZ326_22862 [Fusarium oxysporum f. sp. albedinis]
MQSSDMSLQGRPTAQKCIYLAFLAANAAIFYLLCSSSMPSLLDCSNRTLICGIYIISWASSALASPTIPSMASETDCVARCSEEYDNCVNHSDASRWDCDSSYKWCLGFNPFGPNGRLDSHSERQNAFANDPDTVADVPRNRSLIPYHHYSASNTKKSPFIRISSPVRHGKLRRIELFSANYPPAYG